MYFVKGGRRNLVSVGWQDHVLQVEFKDGRRYQFGGVPLEVKEKLLRVPYPDKLFHQLVKGKYVSKSVSPLDFVQSAGRGKRLPPLAKPLPDFDMDKLPF